MFIKNLKVLMVAVVVLGFYTMIGHIIPQLPSEVPAVLDWISMNSDQRVAAGEELYNGAGGCTACHGLGTRAPNLLADEKGTGLIGARCGKREPGTDCKAYLHEALTAPTKFVVKGYGPIMPDMRRTLDNGQIWGLIAFLESQGGEVTVTPDDIRASAAAAPAAAPAASIDPKAIITENCATCHALNGEGGEIGPKFNGMAALGKDHIRESILNPNASLAKGFENFANMMPPNFGEQLSKEQIEALVNFLASLK